MEIKVKNIKINVQFSQETLMFQGEIYIDGKKVGYCMNDGMGGSTHYHPYQGFANIIREAELYCSSLPVSTYDVNGKSYSIKKTLDIIIEEFVNDFFKKSEEKKNQKKLENNMKKGILYGDENNYSIISWKGFTLEGMLNNPKGRRTLMMTLTKLKGEGKKILNTNIPEFILSEI